MTIAAARFGIVRRRRRVERRATPARGARPCDGVAQFAAAVGHDPARKGRVVQFGTYTCINWLGTLPYVRAWDRIQATVDRDRRAHTRFAFEKNLENVRRAVQQMKIDYPIAIDNDYSIWRAFNNRYWPALYFIDARGRVRQHHFGEGETTDRKRPSSSCWRKRAPERRPGSRVGRCDGLELPADWGNLGRRRFTSVRPHGELSSPGGAALGRRRVYAAPTRLELIDGPLPVSGRWRIRRRS